MKDENFEIIIDKKSLPEVKRLAHRLNNRWKKECQAWAEEKKELEDVIDDLSDVHETSKKDAWVVIHDLEDQIKKLKKDKKDLEKTPNKRERKLLRVTNKELNDLKLALECGLYCRSCWFKTLKVMDTYNNYARRLLKFVHGGYSNNTEAIKRIQEALKKAENDLLEAYKKDVASAVEWLKEELKKTMKHQKEVKGNIWDYNIVGDLIDKAFEGVVKKGAAT